MVLGKLGFTLSRKCPSSSTPLQQFAFCPRALSNAREACLAHGQMQAKSTGELTPHNTPPPMGDVSPQVTGPFWR